MPPDAEPATLQELAQTVLERVDWTLRARDRVLTSAVDEVPFYLNMFLLQMVGAFDAVAQVVANGLAVKDRFASWSNDDWLKRLSQNGHRALASVMERSSVHRDTLAILANLRNAIHDSGLQAMGVAEGSGPARTVLRMRRGEKPVREIEEAMARRGGPQAWGVRALPPIPGFSTIDPSAFVEAALAAGLSALNDLMRATPVADFPNVAGHELRDAPRSDRGPSDPWSRWTRDRVLHLLGIRDEVDRFEAS